MRTEEERKEHKKQYNREYYKKWYADIKVNRRDYYQKRLKQTYKYSKQWSDKNRERVNCSLRKTYKKRKENYKNILNSRISSQVRQALKGTKHCRKWEAILGYTRDQLVKHIEKQFKPGMMWENIGLWHIDHKIPIAAFNYETSEDIDFKKCWDLKNLQPMWAHDNMSKKAKVTSQFQPSLAMTV
jgi:membrane-associated HD superfamily phosphohydrolase